MRHISSLILIASLFAVLKTARAQEKSKDAGNKIYSGLINPKAPLYIIDGNISANIHALNPNDINSISVVKDADAASAYGDAAKNGVIFILTKQHVQNRVNKMLSKFSSSYSKSAKHNPSQKFKYFLNDTPILLERVYNFSADSIINVIVRDSADYKIVTIVS